MDTVGNSKLSCYYYLSIFRVIGSRIWVLTASLHLTLNPNPFIFHRFGEVARNSQNKIASRKWIACSQRHPQWLNDKVMKLYSESSNNNVIRRELQVNGMYNWVGATSRLQAQPLGLTRSRFNSCGPSRRQPKPTSSLSRVRPPPLFSPKSQRTKAKP
jgi:hypothetical protein